ncbi:MAG: hypothetical protein OYL97_08125 [Candidatus Poribacteria bacterium]|nr:hypothetical protein [Candidatus Poribacteria bacterium]
MNILEMPDSKVYELVIKILAEHLGIDGTTRFLGICKPSENDIEVRAQTLSHPEMQKIQEKVYEAYPIKLFVSHRDLSQMSDIAFYKLGLKVISDQLGPVGMARFIRIRKPGTDDYTAERHKWLDQLDRDTILEGIQQIQQK